MALETLELPKEGKKHIKVWVVVHEPGRGRSGIYTYNAHTPMEYFGIVKIFDVDGEPGNRSAKVVFMSGNDALARRVSQEIHRLLTTPSNGALDPRRLLRLLSRVFTDFVGDVDEPMIASTLYYNMDVYMGRPENMYFLAVLE